MSVAVVVQTCDRYRNFWGGFLHFMERHWDREIEAQVYFCNEEEEVSLPGWCTQLRTGRGTFVGNLKRILESISEDQIFYMLEDFWPVAPMGVGLFEALRSEFQSGGWDALQVSGYTPYYDLQPLGRRVAGAGLLGFKAESKWIFNFQARFWRPEVLYKCLVEPATSERAVNSAITVEMASDDFARKNMNLNAALFHYVWYPYSGVAHRGVMSEFGHHLQNIVEIDRYVETAFS